MTGIFTRKRKVSRKWMPTKEAMLRNQSKYVQFLHTVKEIKK